VQETTSSHPVQETTSSHPVQETTSSHPVQESVWDGIFDINYLHTIATAPDFRKIFKDYDQMTLTAEYTCLKQLMAVYKYVKPANKIQDLEKIAQNIWNKKKMGLSSWSELNEEMGDFFYHRDGLAIEEFINLLRAFIIKYTTEIDDSTLGATAKGRRRAIKRLLKAGNLEFSFTCKTFQITIKAINLPMKKYSFHPKTDSAPGICIVVLDMSKKYRLGFNNEKNSFKNLLLNSIQHELHTPVTFIVSSGEQIHSQMKTKYES
jgi:hypothetical protein